MSGKKDWIQSLEGRELNQHKLLIDQVGSIEEIAHSLAHNFRFTRMTRRVYSVAEHCVRGSQLLPASLAGGFLLHELSETYLPDISSPLKPLVFVDVDGELIPWTQLEHQHTETMLASLKLTSIEPLIYSPEVKQMDLAMLAAEKRDLCCPEPKPWGLTVEPANCGIILPWDSDTAAIRFLTRFRELFG